MKLERILLPTDFSELSERAADIACSLAQANAATVHVIHVGRPVEIALEVPEIGILRRKVPPDEAVIKKRLDEFAQKQLGDFGVSVRTVVASGKPADAIVRYAREERIDRIIIATHATGLLRRVFHGSVGKSVLEQAPCPVVMVPPPAVQTCKDCSSTGGSPSVATA